MSDVRAELAEGSDEVATARDGGRGSSDDGVVDGRWYADAPNRLIAYVLDAVVLTILAFVAAIVLSILFGPVVTFDLTAAPYVDVDQALALANAVVATVLGLAYFVIGWRRYAGTIGMRLLGMTISSADGERVGYGQGAVRWLFVGLPIGNQAIVSVFAHGRADVVLYLALVVWDVALGVSIARHRSKRGFHDRIAGTIVVKRGALVPTDLPDVPREDGSSVGVR